MFISLFYSFIIPTSLYISTVACIVLFCADKFTLVRKTKQPPMLDSTMAKTVRTYTLFAVAVHMWMTTRFIYSWPFDEVDETSAGVFRFVNKRAPYFLLSMKPESWHSDEQSRLLKMYRLAAVIVLVVVIYILVVEPTIKMIKEFFFKGKDTAAQQRRLILTDQCCMR
jgi:peptidoglycan/LPS O-acetylase OafA/YrhL